MSDYHVSVLKDESIFALRIKKDGIYFDGTLGGGGHSGEILKNGGILIATDRDMDAINYSEKLFQDKFKGRYTLSNSNFNDMDKVLDSLKIESLDGAILDLGISSHQVDEAERGFSYVKDASLDMRMNRADEVSAYTVVNGYSEEDLADVFFKYGDEKNSRRIAKGIVEYRKKKPIETTLELAAIIEKNIPYINPKSGHPAKRCFQALRIEVNNELDGLGRAVESIVKRLKSGARMCVITFHSTEDRIIKQTFKVLSQGCVCDKSFPICVCGHTASIKLISKIKPSEKELKNNPRSASATLRVIEKL